VSPGTDARSTSSMERRIVLALDVPSKERMPIQEVLPTDWDNSVVPVQTSSICGK
jgi:hypothetical protein